MTLSDKFSTGSGAVWPQCLLCKHRPRGVSQDVCRAYPAGIPREILANYADHRKPQEGDSGLSEDPSVHVLFEPAPGVDPATLAALYRFLDGLEPNRP